MSDGEGRVCWHLSHLQHLLDCPSDGLSGEETGETLSLKVSILELVLIVILKACFSLTVRSPASGFPSYVVIMIFMDFVSKRGVAGFFRLPLQ